MAAGRRLCSNKAAAMAMAVALLALLFVAGESKCNVDEGAVLRECRSCSSGTPSRACCDALRHADFRCLCDSYWGALKGTPYESCAAAIPSKCSIPNAKCH